MYKENRTQNYNPGRTACRPLSLSHSFQ